jgi:hypothetical protein
VSEDEPSAGPEDESASGDALAAPNRGAELPDDDTPEDPHEDPGTE